MTRPASNRALGLRRLIGAGLGPLSAVIDLADHAGQTSFDLTTLGGIAISDFYAFDIVADQAATLGSGTGVQKGVRVSTVGGGFLATGYINMVPGTAVDQTLAIQAEGGSPFTSWCRLVNTNQPGIPCHYKATYSTSAPIMGRINGTMDVIDALRFFVKSDASNVTWLSGKIRITGYRIKASKVATFTDSFDGVKTEIIYNIPPNATYLTLEVEDVSAAIGFGLVARFGNAGVFRSTADQLRQRFTAVTTGLQSSSESVFWITDSAVTQDANAEFWNLNTAAPIIMAASQGDTGSEIRNLAMSPIATPFSQIRFFGFSASEILLTGGTLRITAYDINNKVISWAPDGSASHDFTGLGAYAGAVLTSPTLIPLSGTDTIRATVNGDVGASDYRPHVSATQTQEAAFRISEDNQINARFSAVFGALNQSENMTQFIWGSNHHSSLIRQVSGVRDAAQKDTSIQFKTTGGALMNAAPQPVYLVAYDL